MQAFLPDHDISIASASLFFCQYFGGTVFLSVAKAIFLNRLRPALAEFAPGVDPNKIINKGAMDILAGVAPGDAGGVIKAYNAALVATFVSVPVSRERKKEHSGKWWLTSAVPKQWLPLAAGILAFFFSFGLGWKKLPTWQKVEGDEAERGAHELGQADGTHHGPGTREDVPPARG